MITRILRHWLHFCFVPILLIIFMLQSLLTTLLSVFFSYFLPISYDISFVSEKLLLMLCKQQIMIYIVASTAVSNSVFFVRVTVCRNYKSL